MFRIDINELKYKIEMKCNGINEEINKYISETAEKEMNDILIKLTEIYDKLKNVPEDESRLRDLENYLEKEYSNNMLMLEARYDNAKELLGVLEDTGFDYSKETQKKQFNIQGKQCLIQYQLNICRRTRINIKERLSRNLESEIIEFESKIKKLRENIDNYKKKNNYNQYLKIYERIEEINDELNKSLNNSYDFEDRCRFLEFDARMPPTRDIVNAKDEFTPYVNLWKYIHEFNKFKSDVIETLELK